MTLSIYLIFSAIMFSCSVLGILLNRNNFLLFLIYIKLMFLAIGTNFIAYAKLWNDLNGQIFVFLILTLITIEFALSIAILLKFFKITNSIVVNKEHLENLRNQ